VSFSHVTVCGCLLTVVFVFVFPADALLASPYKTTTFEITNPGSSCQYTWSIADIDGNEVDHGTASMSSFSTSKLTTTGEYSLKVQESGCTDANTDRNMAKTVWVKYVRRELSTLTESDREAFLDAFSTLWTVNTVDGKKVYGDRYKDVYYFATIHNDAGANSVCDEFHGDQGFVNNHIMLGAFLEQSLQLVDPSTALHYWEYESYFDSSSFTARKSMSFVSPAWHLYIYCCCMTDMSSQLDGGSWTDLMTSTWFGSNDPITGKILDGRWANAAVPYMDSDFFVDHGINEHENFFPLEADVWENNANMLHMHSPYGLLRSPWNWNPNTFVTRFNNVNGISNLQAVDPPDRDFYSGVKCSDYELFIKNTVTDQPFSNFLHYAEDNTHGKIHFTIGGAGGEFADEMVRSCAIFSW
jgi:hypothetical protein